MIERYLDTESAIEKALRDYRDQEYIINHGKERISSLNRQLSAIPTGMGEVRSSTPYSGKNETNRAKIIDQKTRAVRAYEKACEYMADINYGWVRLSQREKDIITIRYIDWAIYENGIEVIANKYNVSEREAYRMSKNAAKKLGKYCYDA